MNPDHNAMPPDMDDLLATPLLTPPEGFSERVLARIAAEGLPSAHALPSAVPSPVVPGRWRWLAVIGGSAAGVLGLSQLLAFIFGIWAATAAA